ncbi:ABC1 kinase family protein [Agromyces aerolatus]|uniref:ABC1 kinase family protein n=1 Tax=Agromyces sp. LY-1074 TaxID=3074080 RepID=UPI0028590051|nr:MULTISPECIES: AarF/UbiB family protein [unclassified Agromyces]MDR5700838.1 AarF/UbiB family protein [Agromyces sp. LY-1074]MDR5707359.1 AarF/UbiB family protein [Agromyces sp. LY-1358]
MLEVVATILLGAVLSVSAAWVAQHVLGTAIGWVRAIVFVAIVYALTVPIVCLALEAGDVMVDGQLVVASPIGVVFIAVALGWQFVFAVTIILISELFWPSGRGWHPVRTVRGAFRRRKRMHRYFEILRIASAHGLSLYGSHRRGEEQDISGAIVAAMNEAGVTFVKIGQVLSTRDDILPPEFTTAFATLQMQTTPLQWEDVRSAIEIELGGPLKEWFEWVDETPLAAASLAQVHAARIRPADGEAKGAEVVIKIQRPDARESVLIDSDIIVRLAAKAERRAEWARSYGLSALVGEFVRSLKEELDYRIELENTELLRDTLHRSSVSTIHVPVVYARLCTPRMMVQERVVGTPFSKLNGALPPEMTAAAAETWGVDTAEMSAGPLAGAISVLRPASLPTARDIADSLVDTVFEQIAVRGVFHADLHPGNLILRADGEITLIDFGSVGIVERSLRRVLVAMMSAMGTEDDIALTDLLLMITAPADPEAEIDRNVLQHEVGVILTRVHSGRTDSSIFTDVIDVLRRHQLSLPPALVLVFRTIASLEGTLRRVVPEYDMVEQALSRTRHFARLVTESHGFAADAHVQLQVVAEQLRRLPRRVEVIGSQLENGTFGLNLQMFRDPRERKWISSLVGQVVTTLIGVSLLVIAVFLVVSGDGPQLTEDVTLYPFLGTIVGLGGMLLVLRSLRSSLTRAPR